VDKWVLATAVVLLLLGATIAYASWQQVSSQQRISSQSQQIAQLQQQIQSLQLQIQNLFGQQVGVSNTSGLASNLTDQVAFYQSLLAEYQSLLYSFTASRSGLQLDLTLSNTTIQSGQTLYASAVLRNTLSQNLTLPAFNTPYSTGIGLSNWGNHDGYFCNPPALALAVFSGFYTTLNLSSVEPLYVATPVVPPCAVITSPYYFVLLPNGDSAYEFYSVPPFSGGTSVTMNVSLLGSPLGSAGWNSSILSGAAGYWSGQQSGVTPYGTFQAFPAGIYTIAARDIWGDLAVTYFTVVTPSGTDTFPNPLPTDLNIGSLPTVNTTSP
jgi:hypothetical protein